MHCMMFDEKPGLLTLLKYHWGFKCGARETDTPHSWGDVLKLFDIFDRTGFPPARAFNWCMMGVRLQKYGIKSPAEAEDAIKIYADGISHAGALALERVEKENGHAHRAV